MDGFEEYASSKHFNMHQPIKTPCIKVCVVDGQSSHCLGCGRTLGEIARWEIPAWAQR